MKPFLLLALAGAAWGQFVADPASVPRTLKPPVVFLNGYQMSCPASGLGERTHFASTFGIADQVLERNGQVTLFFDNCLFPGVSIEELGNRFGQFLTRLRYTDGQPVTQIDAVAHSMGGLILRSYLSGKQAGEGVFQPPAEVPIRKAVFLGTPHFGAAVAVFGAATPQVTALTPGSAFLFDLATWNQGTDDLRGVDAIAVAGNAGTDLPVFGLERRAGFDDGVVSLTSASLGFALGDRTRIVPYCHTELPE
ncbi:MAG: esterase/lipase family protein, partial [Bryobacteraceae bacterium]